ncbi:MAG: DUF1538 domain-containing protein [Synergistaceae bacterium]|jgi:hypothetical protein|nr:DUF1538 domain-containing protein [Synergistaceae bacterium]
MKKALMEKLKESLQAVAPIVGIILLLHFTVASMPLGTLVLLLGGAVTLIIGLTLFSLGVDTAMMPMGEHVGSALLRSRNLALLIGGCLVFGFIVTIAEPDLQVMTKQVPSIPDVILLCGVAGGVGLFLVVAVLRVLFRVHLPTLLTVSYAAVFAIAAFSSDYLAVAFDASAVTTGPITVPFLLALGSGIAAVSSGRGTDNNNFGICATCSVGPILAVLIIGLFFDAGTTGHEMTFQESVGGAGELLVLFADGLEHSFFEVAMVVIPIVGMFAMLQVGKLASITKLKLSKTELVRIGIGLLYIVGGLTIFLTGVNRGFMPAGRFLGAEMGALSYNWILMPICLVIGACVVVAEPAVHVLGKQVEEITNGAIPKRVLLLGMAVGVGLALTVAMARMLFNVSIWWVLLPGYALALGLMPFVPNMFVGIGFDSGGVAAGAMSAAFVLPFTLGVCESLGGDAITDAFGVVGMISMMPPITIQIIGLIYSYNIRRGVANA